MPSLYFYAYLTLDLHSNHDCVPDKHTRNTHSQWASRRPQHDVRINVRIAQLCARMSINDIPDRERTRIYTCVHTYIHLENRSLIQSLALMRSAINLASYCMQILNSIIIYSLLGSSSNFLHFTFLPVYTSLHR